MSSKSLFICQNCGYESPKWAGQCSSCNQWNSFVETAVVPSKSKGRSTSPSAQPVIRFSQVDQNSYHLRRLPTRMQEFDRVLGGGIVFGSVVLIGGEPGIGKSTLLTHLTINTLINQPKTTGENDAKNDHNSVSNTVLYVAGEESPEQIALRVSRMQEGKSAARDWRENLLFTPATDVDEIVATIEHERPTLVIVDSIQTLSTQDLTGATGSIGQLKECTERLTRVAKRLHIPIFLVGHVTKEGSIAGPKVLEHMVDAVLELAGERTGQYRTLRAIKNRFGATDEVGIFVHTEEGLIEVTNPSQAFLEERVEGTPGSAIVCVLEGTRPVLVEVQALVIRTQLAMPRRVARGIALPKLQVICAVLEKYCNIPLGQCDVFVNVAGGLTLTEPAVDLGIAVACISSFSNTPTAKGSVYVGEVGLLGEVRNVRFLEKRMNESKRLGFSKVIGPKEIKTVRELSNRLKGKAAPLQV